MTIRDRFMEHLPLTWRGPYKSLPDSASQKVITEALLKTLQELEDDYRRVYQELENMRANKCL